jgi:hypothetical protein
VRPRVAIVLICLVAAACGSSCRTGSAEAIRSGVRGVVLLGPSCPVETEASPCPAEAWVGTVRATRGDESVEARTDARGRFTMPLDPGGWTLTAILDDPGPPSASPVAVRVRPDRFTTVTLTVDTGVR